MNTSDIRATVLHSLQAVAPEANLATLASTVDLREELDIDSMDFLRFVVDLNERLHIEIPERDYPQIRTLDGCVAYLVSKSASLG